MADNSKEFVYEEKPYWRPSYAEEISVLLEEIPKNIARINEFVTDESYGEYVNGFLEEYRNIYLKEICSAENRIICDFEDGVLQLRDVDNKRIESDRHTLKIKNLLQALAYTFGDTFSVKSYNHEFTVGLAKKINEIIGKGLFDNCGEYREKSARLSGGSHFYVEPADIKDSMIELFEHTRAKIEQNLGSVDYIQLAAMFFEKFLKIHPFSNGNGRTARILLSALLIKRIYAPVSVFSYSFNYKSNNDYVDCLIEAHLHKNSNLLNALIIESIHRFCHIFLTALDV